ncbi:MAG: hypothetical protein IH897_02645 [Planctomycetes bacterium]|nr:hypothetical protein [Planctomycetota bacterium]
MNSTSHRTKVSALGVLAVIALFGYLGYALIFPEWKWVARTRPQLIEWLNDTLEPPLEVRRLEKRDTFDYSFVQEGVRIHADERLSLDGKLVVGDGFWVSISKSFPDQDSESYFATCAGPLTITERRIRKARTRQERLQVVVDVQSRGVGFSGEFDRAVLIEGRSSTVIYWSEPRLIQGAVVPNDYRGHRDFIIKIDGISRDSAERIASHLEYVGD